MDFCGYDQFTALQRLADTTPSNKFRYFVSEFSSTYRSVGNAETFLYGKLMEMREEMRISQKAYLSSLGTIAEMYITLFVARAAFRRYRYQWFLALIFRGSGSCNSRICVLSHAPGRDGNFHRFAGLTPLVKAYIIDRLQMPASTLLHYPDKEIVEAKVDETPLFEQLKKYDKREKYLEFIRHPLIVMKDKPELVLIFSIPVALIVFIVMYINLVPVPFSPYLIYEWGSSVDDVIVTAILVALVPYAIFYSMQARHVRKVEASLPDFSRQLGSLVKHNMTLTRAIDLTSQEGRSYIQNDIRALSRDLMWSEKLSIALRRFSDRMKSLAVDRMVILISETEHFTNNLSTTLDLLYHESKNAESLRLERKSDMSVYVVIIFMSFAVFFCSSRSSCQRCSSILCWRMLTLFHT